jgi:hypothetical protein
MLFLIIKWYNIFLFAPLYIIESIIFLSNHLIFSSFLILSLYLYCHANYLSTFPFTFYSLFNSKLYSSLFNLNIIYFISKLLLKLLIIILYTIIIQNYHILHSNPKHFIPFLLIVSIKNVSKSYILVTL